MLISGGLTLFPSAGRDDIYITYWAAHTLAEYGQILNYDGVRVEQSSSLLHVLLLSVLHSVSTLDVEWLGRVASIVAAGVVVILTGTLGQRVSEAAGLTSPWLAATAPFFAYWSFGGLETSLFALTLVLMVMAWSSFMSHPADWGRSSWAAFVATGGVILCRPESPFVLGCLVAGLAVLEGVRRIFSEEDTAPYSFRVLSVLGVVVAVWSAGLFVFRRLYFNSWFPQPVVAKNSGFSWASVEDGWSYVLESWGAHGATWSAVGLIAVASLLAEIGHLIGGKGPARATRSCIVMTVGVYVCFIISSGGDWMEAGRFFAPIAPLIAVMVASVIDAYVDTDRVMVGLVAVLVIAQLASGLEILTRESTSYPIWERSDLTQRDHVSASGHEFDWFELRNRVHARDIPTVIALDRVVSDLKQPDERRVTLMSAQMGMVAYYTAMRHFGEVSFIDRRGLASRHFTDCKVTRGLPRSSLGIGVDTYRDYFELADRIDRECDVQAPDIITDLSFPPLASEWPSYELVYRQTGDLSRDDGLLQGGRVLVGQYIAVHRSRAESLDVSTPWRFEFDSESRLH